MTIGIWTPVAGSTKIVAYGPESLRFFKDRVRAVTLVAGTHLKVKVLGCFPVFIHTVEPVSEDVGITGIPVGPDTNFVIPASTNIWIYSPYEVVTVILDVGTLS